MKMYDYPAPNAQKVRIFAHEKKYFNRIYSC